MMKRLSLKPNNKEDFHADTVEKLRDFRLLRESFCVLGQNWDMQFLNTEEICQKRGSVFVVDRRNVHISLNFIMCFGCISME